MKVLAKQKRHDKEKYYLGRVIGRQSFTRTTMSIFDTPAKEYVEDKLLVKMSDGKTISVWESEIYRIVNEKGQIV